MKKFTLIFSVVLILFLLISGCQKQSPIEPDQSSELQAVSLDKSESLALELNEKGEWEIDPDVKRADGSDLSLEKAACRRLRSFDRVTIKGNIIHYKAIVQVGPGPHDIIGIHRVVKERRLFRPIRTDKTIFLQHGDAKNFEGMFLPGTLSPNMPDDFGLAVFLAENDVDVWGIDQAWTLVPEATSDFSFMADWGLQRQVDDLHLAMGVAYFARMFTRNGSKKLNLLGYSSGVWTGYALLNMETQMPRHARFAGGYIPADGAYKTDNQALKNTFFQSEYDRTQPMLDQGEYGDFIVFAMVADLARSDPDGDSPIIPGFTNMQAALFLAAGPIFGDITFHYFAGIWENDLPVGLKYATVDEYLDFMAAGVPWEATKFINDYCRVTLEIGDVPFDDHLGEITVPILNLAPIGGFGEASRYTTTLLGSSDITHLIPSLNPPEEILLDYGHIDIFLAGNAQSLVWQPMLGWIEMH